MNEKIEPALSAAEWARVLHELAQPVVRDEDGHIETGACITDEGELEVRDGFSVITGRVGDSPVGRVALLNHALPDTDPRKITREAVELLSEIAKEYPLLRPLADALESYLPPKVA